MKEDGLFTKNELKILQELIDKSITQNDQMLNTITDEVKLIYEEQRFHYTNIRKLIEEDIELKKGCSWYVVYVLFIFGCIPWIMASFHMFK